MNTPGLDYVAIDFETATSERYSICSVGIVTVTGGIIMEKYFSLIQPPKNEYTNICVSIHGITPNNTINAPTFPEIYPEIKKRVCTTLFSLCPGVCQLIQLIAFTKQVYVKH